MMNTNAFEQNNGASRHFNAVVVRFTGARGSGKSLLLCQAGIDFLLQGHRVWSNMPIKVTADIVKWLYRYNSPGDMTWHLKHSVGRASESLDWNAFYSLSEDLVEGTVLIDEAQYFSDSRSALSMKNRLLNAIVAQVRKRSLNLFYTVKQFDWIDRRLNYETDLEVQCQGMHQTPWGQAECVTPGDMIIARLFDLSGYYTGRPMDMRSKYIRSFSARIYKNMSRFFECYDTSQVVDLTEAFTNIKLDLQQRIITNKPEAREVESQLYQVAESLLSKGTSAIDTTKFWGIAGRMGVDGKPQSLGRHLANLGIVRKQKYGGSYFYDLTGLGVGENF